MTGEANMGALVVDGLRRDFLRRTLPRGKLVLDLGCGRRPHRELCRERFDRTVAVDVPGTLYGAGHADVYAEGTGLPFRDGTFDAVLCSEVLEHVAEPRLLLAEAHRVLREGGRLVLTTPFLVPVHDEPHDYYRFTAHGLRYLLDETGFSLESLEHFGALGGVTLSFLVQGQLKIWNGLARLAGVPGIAGPVNPFVLLFVWLPQAAYLALVRARVPLLHRLYDRLAYTTKGYGAAARKLSI